MRTFVRIVAVFVALLWACGEKTPEQSPPAQAPAAATPGEEKVPEPEGDENKPVDEPEAATAPDSPEATACRAFLAKAWPKAKAGLEEAGFEVPPSLPAHYVSYDRFVVSCVKLDEAARSCLLGGEEPLAALTDCGLLRLLDLPPLTSALQWETEPLPEDEGKKLLAWIEGTWVRTSKDGAIEESWTFGSDGKIESRTGTPTKGTPAQVSFDTRHRIRLGPAGSVGRRDVFVRGGDDVYYASSNHLAGPFTIEGERFMVGGFGWDRVFGEPGSCRVLYSHGLIGPAECTMSEENGQRVLAVTYHLPRSKRAETTRYLEVDGALLGEYTIEHGAFRRQR